MIFRKKIFLFIVALVTLNVFTINANELKDFEFSAKTVEKGENVLLYIELEEKLELDTYLSVSFINTYSSQLYYNFVTLDNDGLNHYGVLSAKELTKGKHEIIKIEIVDKYDNIIDTLDVKSYIYKLNAFEVTEDEYEDLNKVSSLYVKPNNYEIGHNVEIEAALENRVDGNKDYELGVVFKHIYKNDTFEVPLVYNKWYTYITDEDYKIPEVEAGVYNFYELNQYRTFEYNDKDIRGLVYTYDEDEFGSIQINVKENDDEEKYIEQLSKESILVNTAKKYNFKDIDLNDDEFEIKGNFISNVTSTTIHYNILKDIYETNPSFKFNLIANDFTYSFPVSISYNNKDIERILKRVANEDINIEDTSIKVTIEDYTNNEDYSTIFKNTFDRSILVSGIYNVKVELVYDKKVLGEMNSTVNGVTKTIKYNNNNNDLKGAYKLDENMSLKFVPHKLQSDNVAVINNEGDGTFGIVSIHTKYNDINSGAWYEEAVLLSGGKGLTKGVNDNFYPTGLITRAEFVAMIVNGLDLPYLRTYSTNGYSDVEKDKWYYDTIMIAKENGLLDDIATTEFHPTTFITREEMASIVGKTLNLKLVPMTMQYIYLDQVYVDGININEKYSEEVSNVYKTNLMRGNADGEFNPKGNATRAEAVQIQINLLKLLNYL